MTTLAPPQSPPVAKPRPQNPKIKPIVTHMESGNDIAGLPAANAILDAAFATMTTQDESTLAELRDATASFLASTTDPDARAAANIVSRKVLGSKAPSAQLLNGIPPRYYDIAQTTSAENRTVAKDVKPQRIDPLGVGDRTSLGDAQFERFKHWYPIELAKTGISGFELAGDASQETWAAVEQKIEQTSGDERAQLDAAVGLARFHSVADTLNVESSERYKQQGAKFMCNTYLTDFSDLMPGQPYIPKQWWVDTGSLLARCAAADEVSLVTNKVTSKAPPGLNNWFRDWGSKFGWSEVEGTTNGERESNAQSKANGGQFVVFTTKTGDGSVEPTGGEGHSGVVAPEGPGRNQKFRSGEPVGERFVRSQTGVLRLRQARVAAADGAQPTNIFEGHFDTSFRVYSPNQDDSRGKPSIISQAGDGRKNKPLP